jgi:hypothetical protein
VPVIVLTMAMSFVRFRIGPTRTTKEESMTGYRPGIVVLSSIVAALFVTALAPMAWPQTPGVDPRALIGQWSGSWVGGAEDKSNGKYYLTIERVEGEKVFGKGEFLGTTDNRVHGQGYAVRRSPDVR